MNMASIINAKVSFFGFGSRTALGKTGHLFLAIALADSPFCLPCSYFLSPLFLDYTIMSLYATLNPFWNKVETKLINLQVNLILIEAQCGVY